MPGVILPTGEYGRKGKKKLSPQPRNNQGISRAVEGKKARRKDSSPETAFFSQNPADSSRAGVEKGGSYPQTGAVIHRYEEVIHRQQPVFDGKGMGESKKKDYF